MATELFSVVALPHSVRRRTPTSTSRCSSRPRLDARRRRRRSSQTFTHFPHWATALASDTTIELFDQDGADRGDAAARPRSTRTSGTRSSRRARPVAGRGTPDWSDRRLAHASPRGTVHDVGQGCCTWRRCSPTRRRRRLRADHPLAGAMRQISGGSAAPRHASTTSRVSTPGCSTSVIGETRRASASRAQPLRGHRAAIVDDQDGRGSTARLELHRARRFYERPESKRRSTTSDRSTGATAPTLPRPEPDFHERCALVGDHPALLRRLGLVDRPRGRRPRPAADSRTGSRPRIVAAAATDGACRTTRTRCRAAGDALVTVARTARLGRRAARARRHRPLRRARHRRRRHGAQARPLPLDAPAAAARSRQNGDPIHAAPTGAALASASPSSGTGQALETQRPARAPAHAR